MIRKTFRTQSIQKWLAILIPFIFFLFHAFLFRNWIIDDAGISFVYSRNFASGYGLVSQPNMVPVEGYSNFTWVILMVPFFIIDKFNPIITPKIISLILVLASFITIQKIQEIISTKHIASTAATLIFLSINTSFAIWTTSGLENPLYTLLILLLLWKILQFNINRTGQNGNLVIVAIIASLCALTRPDGAIFFGLFPILLLTDIPSKRRPIKDTIKLLTLYIGLYTLFFGSYLLFRYVYFSDILPNTYYAKGGLPTLSSIDWYQKINNLFHNVSISTPLVLGLILISIYLNTDQRDNLHSTILLTFFLTILAYFLLPFDWMPEFRFATPFFALFYIYIFSVLGKIVEKIGSKPGANIFIASLVLLFAISSIISFSGRTNKFLVQPTVPFTLVAERYLQFDAYASKLSIENGSLLAPDLGGTLYYSELKIYDLAGLTDKLIAKNLGIHQNIFYDYIFETVKPTFIHTHEWWAYAANLDGDERFRRDYIAIDESLDQWVIDHLDKKIYSGNYVRKDAIKNNLNVFLEITSQLSED